MKIYTSKEMREIDRISIQEEKIPSLALMENAAKGVTGEILKAAGAEMLRRTVVIAGKGNNGGDGIAIARILRGLGFSPEVFVLGTRDELSEDAVVQAEKYKTLGSITFSGDKDFRSSLGRSLSGANVVIDAILGTGAKGKVSQSCEEIISLINDSNAFVVSVDIPSGLSGDSFIPAGPAVKADLTVTLGFIKPPLVSPECEEYCGKVAVVDIRLSEKASEKVKAGAEALDIEWARPFFTGRKKSTHKGEMGHLLIVAGSRGKLGASILAGKGALRAGCGLLTVAVPESLANHLTVALPEAMTLPLPETAEGTLSSGGWEKILPFFPSVDALAIGPGLTTNAGTRTLVQKLYKEVEKPCVIDADGLNAFEGCDTLLKDHNGERILTPHPGELGRLLNTNAEAVLQNRYSLATEHSHKWRVCILLKGYKSIIGSADRKLRINLSGGSYMAAPGMGDVLTGVCGALLARRTGCFDAASLSAFWHGFAAEIAFNAKGYGILASEVADSLPLAESILRNDHSA